MQSIYMKTVPSEFVVFRILWKLIFDHNIFNGAHGNVESGRNSSRRGIKVSSNLENVWSPEFGSRCNVIVTRKLCELFLFSEVYTSKFVNDYRSWRIRLNIWPISYGFKEIKKLMSSILLQHWGVVLCGIWWHIAFFFVLKNCLKVLWRYVKVQLLKAVCHELKRYFFFQMTPILVLINQSGRFSKCAQFNFLWKGVFKFRFDPKTFPENWKNWSFFSQIIYLCSRCSFIDI